MFEQLEDFNLSQGCDGKLEKRKREWRLEVQEARPPLPENRRGVSRHLGRSCPPLLTYIHTRTGYSPAWAAEQPLWLLPLLFKLLTLSPTTPEHMLHTSPSSSTTTASVEPCAGGPRGK